MVPVSQMPLPFWNLEECEFEKESEDKGMEYLYQSKIACLPAVLL